MVQGGADHRRRAHHCGLAPHPRSFPSTGININYSAPVSVSCARGRETRLLISPWWTAIRRLLVRRWRRISRILRHRREGIARYYQALVHDGISPVIAPDGRAVRRGSSNQGFLLAPLSRPIVPLAISRRAPGDWLDRFVIPNSARASDHDRRTGVCAKRLGFGRLDAGRNGAKPGRCLLRQGGL